MSNFSNNDPKQDGLKAAFEGIGADGKSGDELFFDPATGKLRSAADEDPDRVPATQMAREGFFLSESGGHADQPEPSSSPADAEPSQTDPLFVDPATGDLRAGRSEDAPDRIPATRMAREGFFCGAAPSTIPIW